MTRMMLYTMFVVVSLAGFSSAVVAQEAQINQTVQFTLDQMQTQSLFDVARLRFQCEVGQFSAVMAENGIVKKGEGQLTLGTIPGDYPLTINLTVCREKPSPKRLAATQQAFADEKVRMLEAKTTHPATIPHTPSPPNQAVRKDSDGSWMPIAAFNELKSQLETAKARNIDLQGQLDGGTGQADPPPESHAGKRIATLTSQRDEVQGKLDKLNSGKASSKKPWLLLIGGILTVIAGFFAWLWQVERRAVVMLRGRIKRFAKSADLLEKTTERVAFLEKLNAGLVKQNAELEGYRMELVAEMDENRSLRVELQNAKDCVVELRAIMGQHLLVRPEIVIRFNGAQYAFPYLGLEPKRKGGGSLAVHGCAMCTENHLTAPTDGTPIDEGKYTSHLLRCSGLKPSLVSQTMAMAGD